MPARPPAIEEVRFRVGEELVTGQWWLPGGTPPFALVFIPPFQAGRDRFGSDTGLPGPHPNLTLAHTLAEAGMATFACDAPRALEGVEELCSRARAVAAAHHLISRSRVASLDQGDSRLSGSQLVRKYAGLLEPEWERGTRPPGTAIG